MGASQNADDVPRSCIIKECMPITMNSLTKVAIAAIFFLSRGAGHPGLTAVMRLLLQVTSNTLAISLTLNGPLPCSVPLLQWEFIEPLNSMLVCGSEVVSPVGRCVPGAIIGSPRLLGTICNERKSTPHIDLPDSAISSSMSPPHRI